MTENASVAGDSNAARPIIRKIREDRKEPVSVKKHAEDLLEAMDKAEGVGEVRVSRSPRLYKGMGATRCISKIVVKEDAVVFKLGEDNRRNAFKVTRDKWGDIHVSRF